MRWLKFNAVGAMGAILQLALLALCVHVVGMHYLLATALSVEAAILHNFLWHRRWTWADRRGASHAAAALARFNLTNGLVSIGGNLLSACLLTGFWRIDPVVANLVSMAVGSLANLFLCDRVVFVSHAETPRHPNNSGKDGTKQQPGLPHPRSREAGSADHRFCGPRLFGPVMERSISCARIGGHSHPVDDQTTASVFVLRRSCPRIRCNLIPQGGTNLRGGSPNRLRV
jgi:putative flippase GtrA